MVTGGGELADWALGAGQRLLSADEMAAASRPGQRSRGAAKGAGPGLRGWQLWG